MVIDGGWVVKMVRVRLEEMMAVVVVVIMMVVEVIVI